MREVPQSEAQIPYVAMHASVIFHHILCALRLPSKHETSAQCCFVKTTVGQRPVFAGYSNNFQTKCKNVKDQYVCGRCRTSNNSIKGTPWDETFSILSILKINLM